MYYYLWRIRDYIYLFFHSGIYTAYQRKKIELDNKEAFEKDLRLIDNKEEREFWEFEYGQRYSEQSPEALGQGCAGGCDAVLSVGSTYIFAIIIIVAPLF